MPIARSHSEGAAAQLPLCGPDPNDKVQMVALDDTKIEAKKIPAATLYRSCPRKPRGRTENPNLNQTKDLWTIFSAFLQTDQWEIRMEKILSCDWSTLPIDGFLWILAANICLYIVFYVYNT